MIIVHVTIIFVVIFAGI